MTQKMNVNVHTVSHVKEKLLHVDIQTQAESQKLAEVDEEIAKVSNVNVKLYCYYLLYIIIVVLLFVLHGASVLYWSPLRSDKRKLEGYPISCPC